MLSENIHETQHTNLKIHTAQVTNTFQTDANETIPRTKRSKKAYKDNWFRDERVEAINKRINTARKFWSRNPAKRTGTSNRHPSPSREIKAIVREEKQIEWCRSIDAHTSLTGMCKNIRRVRGRPKQNDLQMGLLGEYLPPICQS